MLKLEKPGLTIWSIALFVLTIIIFYVLFDMHVNNAKKVKVEETESMIDPKILYQRKLELDYARTKDNIIDYADSIIHHYAPTSDLHGVVIVELCEIYDVDIRFVLAQGLAESHYGTKGLARRTNSVFNIYAYDSTDYEELNDKGKFNHPDKSVEPYLRLLNDRYLSDGRTEYDLLENYVTTGGLRYASNENYERALKSKYDAINSSKIDSLINDMYYIRLKLNR